PSSSKSANILPIPVKAGWECYEILQALSLRNKLVLVWIPGHEGHEGNERADCLAKEAQ
ncbi:hypothetical protein EVAR_71852_1, partial [Eumeta japonica]